MESNEGEDKIYKCRCCGNITLGKEDRREQYDRIKNGIKGILGDSDRLDEFTKNYIGFGPNYMYKCTTCGALRKIIPDGRDRE